MIDKKFLNFLQFEKRYSLHTIIAYETDLTQFKDFVKSNYSIDDLSSANHHIIRSWMVNQIEQGVGSRSVNRKISVLKSFYKFLLKQKLISQSPMSKIVSPKAGKRLPVFIDKPKMQKLLSEDIPGDDFTAVRDNLIIDLFYNSGIRLSELVNLSLSDFDTSSCKMKVLGKRNKERIIPYSTPLAEMLSAYIKSRSELLSIMKLADHGKLFICKNGKPVYQKLVYRVVKEQIGKVSTASKRSPHVLRHTFATHMLENGADINAVKELLGHSSLAATQVYTHNTIEKLKNAHRQAHPKG